MNKASVIKKERDWWRTLREPATQRTVLFEHKRTEIFPKNQMFTVKQLAEELSVSKHTIYDLIRKREIRARPITKRELRILGSDINEYLYRKEIERLKKLA